MEIGRLSASSPTRLRGAHVAVREGASHPFPLGKWQHVAFVLDGTLLRLYRNGINVASVPFDGVLADPAVPTLAVGVKTDDSGVLPSASPANAYAWHGRIAELAIFHSALSEEDIRRLYQGHRR